MWAKLSFRRKVAAARKHLYAHLGIQQTLSYFGAGEICEPEAETVMVLAPHMDDEVLGCGGTIARHAQAGAMVHIVFLTDGRHKIPLVGGDTEAERAIKERELIITRREEARRAAEVLGVHELHFLDAMAGHLATSDSIIEQVRAQFANAKPAIIYLPFFLDRHPDHRAVSRVLLAAIADTDVECRAYEVWTPLSANLIVAIDQTLDLKKRALDCYRSQLAHTDFLHIGVGLSAYRSSAMPGTGCRYAEAFCALPIRDYRALYESWICSLG